MNKEQLEQRIQQLSQEAEQLKANLAATIGAIQDCHHWLQQLDQPPAVEAAAE
jgi:prefoldin subunit 5